MLIRNYRLVSNVYYFNEAGRQFIERAMGRFRRQPEGNVKTTYTESMRSFEGVLMTQRFNKVLDFLEIVVEEQAANREFVYTIKTLFKKHAAAYWLDTSEFPYKFVPCANKEQGAATEEAIKTLREEDMEGAATHLRDAAGHINDGQFADSIADSIHAVESVARVLDPEANQTLTPALNSLQRAGVLNHPALKEAFSKLYGYTSDEEGIRHALLERGTADVGQEEALFMFGACASFAAYLTQKHQQVQESSS